MTHNQAKTVSGSRPRNGTNARVADKGVKTALIEILSSFKEVKENTSLRREIDIEKTHIRLPAVN